MNLSRINLPKKIPEDKKAMLVAYIGDPIRVEICGSLTTLLMNYYRIQVNKGLLKALPKEAIVLKEVFELFPQLAMFK